MTALYIVFQKLKHNVKNVLYVREIFDIYDVVPVQSDGLMG